MPTKKVPVEILLTDILERLRTLENNTLSSDKKLDDRLCKIENEIENVKKAAKTFSLFVKIVSGLIAFIVACWNIVGKIMSFKK